MCYLIFCKIVIFKFRENKVKYMLRLFACIWIPGDIHKNVQKFQEKIKKLPMKAKFIEPENLHITITFLGSVEEDELKSLIKKIDTITKNVKKFHAKIETLKIIPNEEYIRVIGVNVSNNQNLADLIKKIGDSIGGKFYTTAKLTLCRVKSIFDKQIIKDFIEKNHNVKLGEFVIESVALVKSTLTRQGPVYETIHTSMLK